jgi:hypothetical protein
MHTKINIALLEPNFLLHILWSNKPRKPTNTVIAIIDLALHIYD